MFQFDMRDRIRIKNFKERKKFWFLHKLYNINLYSYWNGLKNCDGFHLLNIARNLVAGQLIFE